MSEVGAGGMATVYLAQDLNRHAMVMDFCEAKPVTRSPGVAAL